MINQDETDGVRENEYKSGNRTIEGYFQLSRTARTVDPRFTPGVAKSWRVWGTVGIAVSVGYLTDA